MKKIILGIFIGIILTFFGYVTYFNVKAYIFNQRIEDKVMEAGRTILLDTFPEAKIKSIMIEPSNDHVNFAHDKLYKIHISYERKKQFKDIAFNIGVYKRRIFTPPELQLLELDKDAKILFDRNSE